MLDAPILESLARARFPDPPLTEAEIKLVRAAPTGEFAVCGPNMNSDDPANDPNGADPNWKTERTLRADLIRWLCVDRQARAFVDPRGIQIYGAKIPDALDLSFVAIPFPIFSIRCRWMGDFNADGMEIPELSLEGSRADSFHAFAARVRGTLFLRNGFRAEGTVGLSRIKVEVDLDCSNATFKNPANPRTGHARPALTADGATVNGNFALSNGCRAEGEVRLLDAQIGGDLDCEGGVFKNAAQANVEGSGRALTADGVVVKGSVFLRNGFIADGEVRLLSTQIGGDIDCSGAVLTNPPRVGLETSGKALSADRAVVRGSIFLKDRFRANGAVGLPGTYVGGDLNCENAVIVSPCQPLVTGSGIALNGTGIVAERSVLLSNNFHAEGATLLVQAQIGGNLDCGNGAFLNPQLLGVAQSGQAIAADGAVIKKNAFFRAGFRSVGEVRLLEAQIGGDLDFTDGTLKNTPTADADSNGRALTADGAAVNGQLVLAGRFSADGQVRLRAMRIGGDVTCDNAKLSNPCQNGISGSGSALNLDGTEVSGSVFLRHGFHASGAVLLQSAHLGRDLECEGAIFSNPQVSSMPQPSGIALFADGTIIRGSVALRFGFKAEGEVRFVDAQIGGYIDCVGAEFNNPHTFAGGGSALAADRIQVAGDIIFGQLVPVAGNKMVNGGSEAVGDVSVNGAQIGGDLNCTASSFNGTLSGERASIKGRIYWMSITHPEYSRLKLTSASAATLVDDAKSWPPKGNIYLDGFTYQRFGSDPPIAVTDRLTWLSRMPSFSLQPYRQLAKVLSESGDNDGSVVVLVEMERRRRLSDSWTERPEDAAMESIGYGYLPLQALSGLALLTVLGWVVYRRAYLAKTMVPTEEHAYQWYKEKDAPPPYYPRFNALVYTLENVVPLVKLGQADRWQPEPEPAHRHKKLIARIRYAFTRRRLLRGLLWLLIIGGWILATLFAAGFVGIVRKD